MPEHLKQLCKTLLMAEENSGLAASWSGEERPTQSEMD